MTLARYMLIIGVILLGYCLVLVGFAMPGVTAIGLVCLVLLYDNACLWVLEIIYSVELTAQVGDARHPAPVSRVVPHNLSVGEPRSL